MKKSDSDKMYEAMTYMHNANLQLRQQQKGLRRLSRRTSVMQKHLGMVDALLKYTGVDTKLPFEQRINQCITYIRKLEGAKATALSKVA